MNSNSSGSASPACARGREGEAHEVRAGRAEGRARDGGDPGLLQQDAADLLGGEAGTGDVDPGVERPLRLRAAEAGHAVEVARELLAARAKLGDHARRGAGAVLQRLDGGDLR